MVLGMTLTQKVQFTIVDYSLKLWYCGTLIYDEKKWKITKHNKTLSYNGKNYGNISEQLKFLNLFIALEIKFTMDITMVLWKKNFGTIHDSTQSDSQSYLSLFKGGVIVGRH